MREIVLVCVRDYVPVFFYLHTPPAGGYTNTTILRSTGNRKFREGLATPFRIVEEHVTYIRERRRRW
jgi:hypothetical protein